VLVLPNRAVQLAEGSLRVRNNLHKRLFRKKRQAGGAHPFCSKEDQAKISSALGISSLNFNDWDAKSHEPDGVSE
jgi:hypothetical protein